MAIDDLELTRAAWHERAAQAFSQDSIDLDRYEALVTAITAARDITALQALDSLLPALSAAPPVQRLVHSHSRIRKQGRWLESPVVDVDIRHSSATLDLRTYIDEASLTVHLNLNVQHSSIAIIVPMDFTVLERFDETHGSVYRDRVKYATTPERTIILTGIVAHSTVKIHRRWH